MNKFIQKIFFPDEFKKEIKQEFEEQKQKMPETMSKLLEVINGGEYIVYMGKLKRDENNNDKLEHNVFLGRGFKEDDVALCIQNFRILAGDMFKTNKENTQKAEIDFEPMV